MQFVICYLLFVWYQLFATDEDPQGRNVSLKSVFATWMLKKVSVQFVNILQAKSERKP